MTEVRYKLAQSHLTVSRNSSCITNTNKKIILYGYLMQ